MEFWEWVKSLCWCLVSCCSLGCYTALIVQGRSNQRYVEGGGIQGFLFYCLISHIFDLNMKNRFLLALKDLLQSCKSMNKLEHFGWCISELSGTWDGTQDPRGAQAGVHRCAGTCLYLRCPGTGAWKVQITQLKSEAETAAVIEEKYIGGKKEGVLRARRPLKETYLPEGCESRSGYRIWNWLLW